jgi:hypothetical protein
MKKLKSLTNNGGLKWEYGRENWAPEFQSALVTHLQALYLKTIVTDLGARLAAGREQVEFVLRLDL